ncbi:MAG: hypothetical protein ACI9IA_000009 [Enterobacterales bacterium]|jgi:hypothetical protein
MTAAVACSILALGLLTNNYKRLGLLTLILAVALHAAAIVMAFFILAVFLIYQLISKENSTKKIKLLLNNSYYALLIFAFWILIYLVFNDSGLRSLSSGIKIDFDVNKIFYLFFYSNFFIPLTAIVGLVFCIIAYINKDNSYRLSLSIIFLILISIIGFIFISNNYPSFPAMHPIGRLFYLLPCLIISSLTSLGIQLWARGNNKSLLVIFSFTLLSVIFTQNLYIINSQFNGRSETSLGSLHNYMSQLASERHITNTAFVFNNHNYGTVLAAAKLYEGKFFWMSIYTKKTLYTELNNVAEIVYMKDKDSPDLNVPGFCQYDEDFVLLGTLPQKEKSPRVDILKFRKCN